MSDIETHTDGTLWAKCSRDRNKRFEHEGNPVRIYHPNAVNDYDSSDGADDHYSFPDCGATWWVEHDG